MIAGSLHAECMVKCKVYFNIAILSRLSFLKGSSGCGGILVDLIDSELDFFFIGQILTLQCRFLIKIFNDSL